MFEKESELWATKELGNGYVDDIDNHSKTFQKGAEFAYNKANEWHYVKDKLPPSGETVLLYYGTNIMGKAVMSIGYVDCKGNWYKNVDGEPIKWQEIVLPKEENYV